MSPAPSLPVASTPDRPELAVPAKPAQQLPIATAGSRELAVAEQPSLLVDDGSVVGATVGSTPPMTTRVRLGILGWPFRSTTGQEGTHRPGGRTHQ